MKGKKIDFYLENPTVLEVKEQRSGVREVVEIWKTEMMNRCEKIYPDAEAGILEAMLFGEKRELSGDIKELYQATSRCIDEHEEADGVCPCCGKKAKHVVYFARAY